MAIKCRLAVQPINHSDNAIKDVALSDIAVGHQRVQDGRGISESRGFDQHPVIGDLSGIAPTL